MDPPFHLCQQQTTTHFLLWVVPLSACRAPWKICCGSGISNILRSSIQYRIQFHSFMQWLLRASVQGLLCLSSSPEPREDFTTPVLCILHESKTRTTWMTLTRSATSWKWTRSPFIYPIYSKFHSSYFRNLNIIKYNSLYLVENSLGYFHPGVESLTG